MRLETRSRKQPAHTCKPRRDPDISGNPPLHALSSPPSCRRLSSADAAALLSGLDDDSNKQKQGGDGDDLTPAEQLARLTPPRPIDITIQPETAVVVITGTHVCVVVCSAIARLALAVFSYWRGGVEVTRRHGGPWVTLPATPSHLHTFTHHTCRNNCMCHYSYHRRPQHWW